MIKIPARPDGRWTVTYGNDKLPDIVSTRNLTFDKGGFVRLSKPVTSYYSSNDSADFQLPLYFARSATAGVYYIVTEDKTYSLYLDDHNGGTYEGTYTVTVDGATGTPTNSDSTQSGVCMFSNKLCVVSSADRHTYTNTLATIQSTSWNDNDTSATLSASYDLPACNFASVVQLAVGNGSNVDTYNTSFAAANQLVLPSEFTVTGVAYNNGLLGITTQHKKYQRSMFFVWDGQTTAANYGIEVPSSTCQQPVAYGGTFAFFTPTGTLYQWQPNALTVLAQFPLFFGRGGVTLNGHVNASIVSDGESIHINTSSALTGSVDMDNQNFVQGFNGGIWTFDPRVGLYHRHAPTGRKVVVDTIATTAVNTSTDSITVAAAPETGTPVFYTKADGTALAGLTSGGLYYTIKVDATTVQLAASYQDAIDGIEIDLTGTGNNNQTLQFHLKSDFGQSFIYEQQGAIFIEDRKRHDVDYYYQRFFFGSHTFVDTTTDVDAGCLVLESTENRGYFVTSKFSSANLQDDWNKLFIKHTNLATALDKIVVKYRVDNDVPLTKIYSTSTGDGAITWSDSDTFTTTDTQWEAVQEGDEVEIIQGTGAGYLVHVSSISESGGTYTVNIDESIKNLTAAKTGRAVASRWKKLTTLDNGIITNDDGYSEIAVGVKSKQIQFKIELRGEDVEIEEMLVAHESHKPAA